MWSLVFRDMGGVGTQVTIQDVVGLPDSLHFFLSQRFRLEGCPEVAREEAGGQGGQGEAWPLHPLQEGGQPGGAEGQEEGGQVEDHTVTAADHWTVLTSQGLPETGEKDSGQVVRGGGQAGDQRQQAGSLHHQPCLSYYWCSTAAYF